jgi:2-polyprenyl-3-methyl-5-hydroxy-6-metoxy-1,4-benzoquinol methylase
MNLFKIFKRREAFDLGKKLTAEEWAVHYNASQADGIVESIRANKISVQSDEILRIISKGESSLEIGSGSGQSSVCLAMKGVDATVLDYEQKCLDLTVAIAEKINVKIKAVKADAEKSLPFSENQFDYIFHAGLLEHYTSTERINLLKLWRPYSKKMVSMVPNASSIAYRVGKAMMEQNKTWSYGVENPLYSAKEEFIQAGYNVLNEYTIGEEHALSFLPSNHYLKGSIKKWIKNNPCKDNCGQGYLLVTIGVKK